MSNGNAAVKLINIGYGNVVLLNRVIAVISPESAPVRRIISEARGDKLLVDATYGRRTRAVIITDSGHVILSSIAHETVAARISAENIFKAAGSDRPKADSMTDISDG